MGAAKSRLSPPGIVENHRVAPDPAGNIRLLGAQRNPLAGRAFLAAVYDRRPALIECRYSGDYQATKLLARNLFFRETILLRASR